MREEIRLFGCYSIDEERIFDAIELARRRGARADMIFDSQGPGGTITRNAAPRILGLMTTSEHRELEHERRQPTQGVHG